MIEFTEKGGGFAFLERRTITALLSYVARIARQSAPRISEPNTQRRGLMMTVYCKGWQMATYQS